ncbi:MAG: glycosyltransferase family 39 protein [Anaerolineae bacterium]|nr:glycosyltransferase family 39 protein [Anaerolineae bacterium]
MTFRRLFPIFVLLLGAWLRFHAAAQDVRFHPDEALFASFARAAAVNGDWLLHGSLDKTPLTIYAQAVSMILVGVTPLPNDVLTLDVPVGEFAARLPNMLAGIVQMAVLYAVARRLPSPPNPLSLRAMGKKYEFRHRGEIKWLPIVVMGLAAVSPYLVAFSGTAFTDGVMLLCVTLALWMASRGGWFWAGVWLILGFWCKQQAILFLPLVVGMGWAFNSRRLKPPGYEKIKPTKGAEKNTNILFRIMMFVVPMAVGFGLLLVWDSGRGQETSLWALAVANNDPGQLARADELLPRLLGWIFYGQYLFGAWWMTAILVGIGVISAVGRLARRHSGWWVDAVLLGYVVLYLLAHWLIAINIYDRYLLLILLPLLLLVGRGLESLGEKIYAKGLVYLLMGLVMLFLAVEGANGRLPIGGDRGEHAGIDELGRFLESKPVATIIYDRWLGWELRYYLGAWPDERVVYYPTAVALAADAILQRDFAPRYFVAPINRPYQQWVRLLDYAGFEIRLVYDHAPFVVYELIPPAWIGCASSVESSWPGRIERFLDSCG